MLKYVNFNAQILHQSKLNELTIKSHLVIIYFVLNLNMSYKRIQTSSHHLFQVFFCAECLVKYSILYCTTQMIDVFWWTHRTESNCDFLQFDLVITHSQALEEGTQVSYPIYVIDNNPPAFFTVYLTACQFIK